MDSVIPLTSSEISFAPIANSLDDWATCPITLMSSSFLSEIARLESITLRVISEVSCNILRSLSIMLLKERLKLSILPDSLILLVKSPLAILAEALEISSNDSVSAFCT
ncbi:hypothetical protein D3C77_548550 [compost metagenome]